MADVKLCPDGCCEVMEGHDGDYLICADCGNDEGHEHGKPCSFCGAGGLSHEVMEAREEAHRRELEEHAQREMAAAQLDPRQQRYLKNAVTGRLIRSNAQVHRAIENKQQLVQLTYGEALSLYRQEEAVKKQAMAKVSKRKAARKARRKNR